MEWLIYSDGEIHDQEIGYKSDDYKVITTDSSLTELYTVVNSMFGNTKQAKTVMFEVLDLIYN